MASRRCQSLPKIAETALGNSMVRVGAAQWSLALGGAAMLHIGVGGLAVSTHGATEETLHVVELNPPEPTAADWTSPVDTADPESAPQNSAPSPNPPRTSPAITDVDPASESRSAANSQRASNSQNAADSQRASDSQNTLSASSAEADVETTSSEAIVDFAAFDVADSIATGDFPVAREDATSDGVSTHDGSAAGTRTGSTGSGSMGVGSTGSGQMEGGSRPGRGGPGDAASRSNSVEDESAPVRVASANWHCPWPEGSDDLRSSERVVTLRVLVGADGRLLRTDILSAPEPSFADAARRCAEHEQFLPARDRRGNPRLASSAPLRVRFTR